MNGSYEGQFYADDAQVIDEYEQAEPVARVLRREAGITAAIWGPALAIAALFYALKVPQISAVAAGVAVVVHVFIRREFLVYLLVLVIPLEWMITVVHNVTTVSKIIAMVAFVVALPRIFRTVFSKWDPCAKWVALLVTWASFGILWARYPLVSLISWQTLALLWVGLPLLIMSNVRTEAAIRGLLMVFVLGCLVSAIGIMGTRNISAVVGGAQREVVTSLVGAQVEESEDMNIVARYLAVGVLIAIYLFFTSSSFSLRALLAGFMLASVLAIILLKGRAVYLGLPTALVLGVLALRGAGLGKRLLIAVSMCILLGLVGAVAMKLGFIGMGVIERFETIFEEGAGAGNRLYLWRAHVQALVDTVFMGKGIKMMFWASDVMQVAHNDWLSVAADLGIVGLVAFFGFHLTLFRRMQRLMSIWPKLLCLTVWSFIILAGLVETDFLHKAYTLSLSMILLMCRHQEELATQMAPEPTDFTLEEQLQFA